MKLSASIIVRCPVRQMTPHINRPTGVPHATARNATDSSFFVGVDCDFFKMKFLREIVGSIGKDVNRISAGPVRRQL
jgi:hypothetical protein